MKALMMTQYGDVDPSLEFKTLAEPSIETDQVLILTHAASINPIDYKVLRGDFKALTKVAFPAGIGRDVSGVIVKVGPNVKRFKPGDEVISRVDEAFVGTLAEYTVSKLQHFVQHGCSIVVVTRPINLPAFNHQEESIRIFCEYVKRFYRHLFQAWHRPVWTVFTIGIGDAILHT